MSSLPVVHWKENEQTCHALWRSESGTGPGRVVAIDDRTRADDAYGLACQGVALVWRGDFQNARQMLNALGKRADRPPRKSKDVPIDFHRYRQLRGQRARTLGMLMLLFDAEYRLALPRAPDLRDACLEAFGPATGPTLISLRAVLGLIGAHEWRVKGIAIAAVGGRIHPHYGVFAPIRSEYVELVDTVPLPPRISTSSVAFDIGTGTGVLAAVLARRGVRQVWATDVGSQALACARENIDRLALTGQVSIIEADLFPAGRAALVVCNPPWLPARPTSPLEHAIYDPESRMLHAFLKGLPAHLERDGEGWLILSDLAEHLGLRSREALLAAIEAAGLTVLERHDMRPRHRKTRDATDPLHPARMAEVTSLWRLAAL